MQDLENILLRHSPSFAPVVQFDPLHDKLITLDFTENNRELNEDILNDIKLFSEYVEQKLSKAGALFGIGGYAEHRTIYSRSSLFDSESQGEEPRRLHLGTDIWGAAGTAVMAPLDGVIHSFAFNGKPGDYGATIIIGHRLEGIDFYSLYGHLSLASINDLQEGAQVIRGEQFAAFGTTTENGYWPPHLHFQLIIDVGGQKGDYPGVCKYGDRKEWLANCPDPDLILQLNRFT
jgi:murein DD-endopeptidase MepM/ murein hydrolase activator NlpD